MDNSLHAVIAVWLSAPRVGVGMNRCAREGKCEVDNNLHAVIAVWLSAPRVGVGMNRCARGGKCEAL